MKGILFILLFIISISNSHSQNSWGIVLNGNLTTQTNYNPSMPEDGTFMWNWQKSISPGIYYTLNHSKKLSQRFYLLYAAKGFNDFTQVGHILFPGILYYGTFKNKFNFISFQHNFKIKLNKSSDLGFHLLSGYELSYLVDNYIDAGINRNRQSGTYQTGRYPYNEYKDFNKLVFSGQIGIGTDIKNLLELNIFHNRDISKFINREIMVVKNWSFNFQLLFNIRGILDIKVK